MLPSALTVLTYATRRNMRKLIVFLVNTSILHRNVLQSQCRWISRHLSNFRIIKKGDGIEKTTSGAGCHEVYFPL